MRHVCYQRAVNYLSPAEGPAVLVSDEVPDQAVQQHSVQHQPQLLSPPPFSTRGFPGLAASPTSSRGRTMIRVSLHRRQLPASSTPPTTRLPPASPGHSHGAPAPSISGDPKFIKLLFTCINNEDGGAEFTSKHPWSWTSPSLS